MAVKQPDRANLRRSMICSFFLCHEKSEVEVLVLESNDARGDMENEKLDDLFLMGRNTESAGTLTTFAC